MEDQAIDGHAPLTPFGNCSLELYVVVVVIRAGPGLYRSPHHIHCRQPGGFLGSSCLAPRENTSAAKTGTLGGGMVHKDVASPMAPKTLLLPRVGVPRPVEGHGDGLQVLPVTIRETFV